MYLIKTYLDYSPIHGLGVFAAEDIAPGAEVWRFIPGVDRTLDPREVEKYPDAARRFVHTYGYMAEGKWWMCRDHAMFCNHDENPNTIEGNGGGDVAARMIAKGEEITCNYHAFDENADKKLAGG